MRHDIIIAGVGGQGILTIARVLSLAAMAKGLHVKQAEVHGMSQRGGAVYSHLRISDREIFSDLIPAGQADMILAIEPLEALRYVSMLREDGTVVASTNAEVNIPDYPAIERVLAHIADFESHVAVDMEKLARAAGGVLSANIVALGAASLYLGFTIHELQAAVEQLFEVKGEKIVQTNIRALRFGRTAASAYREALERGVHAQHARGWIATLSPEHLAAEDLDFAELDVAVDESRLTGAEAHAFESLLRTAYDEDRRQLYEHEVYRLIELVGAITPPRHAFIAKSSTIAEDVLNAYPGDKVVIKLVSTAVVHKTEAGAVQIVPKDLDRVRAEIERMITRHAPKGPVAGVLVVEFVEHAHGLGSELFVGIRATREFGPVIAAGLGGVQTEYLASKMRPGVAVAKAVAWDIDAEGFLELFKSTAAYDILSGRVRGHDRVVSDGELLRCFRAFISIARQFCVDRGEEGPDINELEVNPFAFVNQHLVPLDGRGSLRPAAKPRPARPEAAAKHLLEPERISLVGVSAKPGSFGRVILGNVLESGFDADRITIIKPDEAEFEGIRCVPTLSDLPDPVDLLVITVPAKATPEIIREANASGKVRSGIIISGGAGEAEGSEAIGEEIAAAILEGRALPNGGAAFLGPNCMGVRSRPGLYDTFFVPEDKLPMRRGGEPQPIALVSQSGAFIVSRLSSQTELDPRFAISIGNQCDLTVSDMVRAVGLRDDISVVGVYLEGFIDLDGADMLRVVAELRERGKSVVFYKAGRTESGRSAAAGHTAAVAGDYDICQTAMSLAGAFVAQDFREFGEALELAVHLTGRTVGEGRVFALTNAGMEAVAMADSGVRLNAPSEALHCELDTLLTTHGLRGLVSARNPLDLAPAAGEAAYDELVRAALDSAEVDAVIVSCVPLAPSLHSLAADLDHPTSFVQLAAKWRAHSEKAIVTVFDGGPEYDALRAGIRAAGLPVFRSADDAARLLHRWISQMASR
ncbi:MAG: indolepyruvate oxidoreductase subunit beta [Methanoregulaceae archaeon]|nr:indolepyruvate oxidoreductase subunit beta [Methanoregulaceae archaeon]